MDCGLAIPKEPDRYARGGRAEGAVMALNLAPPRLKLMTAPKLDLGPQFRCETLTI